MTSFAFVMLLLSVLLLRSVAHGELMFGVELDLMRELAVEHLGLTEAAFQFEVDQNCQVTGQRDARLFNCNLSLRLREVRFDSLDLADVDKPIVLSPRTWCAWALPHARYLAFALSNY